MTMIAGRADAQDLPRGEIVHDVECLKNAAQHYSLYLPSYFDTSRQWPLILAFDAGGRGREGVERYRAAAEQYGYIVAGSHNSRNGPWDVGIEAAAAMAADLNERFPIDPRRVYAAGMSGGARVAIMLAQRSKGIAGVLASSAGYSTTFRRAESFPLFGSAGTEDFNYREMRAVDRLLESPHRVEVFEGGHTWLPAEVATRGVEWMEILAMKEGTRQRDQALVDQLFSRRLEHANAQAGGLARLRALKQLVEDFDGLHDVAAPAAAAAALEGREDVAAALSEEKDEEAREVRVQKEADLLTRRLGWPEQADAAFVNMKLFVARLLEVSQQEADSSERRIARRVLSGLRASRSAVPNPGYQEFIGSIQIAAPAHN